MCSYFNGIGHIKGEIKLRLCDYGVFWSCRDATRECRLKDKRAEKDTKDNFYLLIKRQFQLPLLVPCSHRLYTLPLAPTFLWAH